MLRQTRRPGRWHRGGWRIPWLCVCAISATGAVAAGQVCQTVIDAAPGDVFGLSGGRVYQYDRDTGGVECIGLPGGLVAVSGGRDGLIYGLTASGSALYVLDPTVDAPPMPITLSETIASPVDIAVTEGGWVAVLRHGGSGPGAIMRVDPLTGVVTTFSPPPEPGQDDQTDPNNYVGANGAVPTSIAMCPGGALLVAQVRASSYDVIHVAPGGVQSLHTFVQPSLTTPTKLAIDVLPSGRALLVTDAGDVLVYTFRTNAVQHIGNVGQVSTALDVSVIGVRHAYVACNGLHRVRWSPAGDVMALQPVPAMPPVTSLITVRGPVPAGGAMSGYGFENAGEFTDAFHVSANAGTGSADVLNLESNAVLRMACGENVGGAIVPVSVITETFVPRAAIRLQCDYRFLTPRAAVIVYVNGRRACAIVAPPEPQSGSPISGYFAHFEREISLDRLGLLASPRLVVELELRPLANDASTPAAEVYLDNLILSSSPCAGIMFGDLNLDGSLDLCDAQHLAEHYGEYDLCADLNRDGYVDAYDFATLLVIAAREYSPLCENPPLHLRGGVPVDGTTPLQPGYLYILAKDVYWEDWIYEYDPNTAQCTRKFRRAGSPEELPPAHTQLRHDGHGVLYAVDFAGQIERWANDGDQLVCTQLAFDYPVGLPEELQGVGPVDVAVTRGAGLWVNYAPFFHAYDERPTPEFSALAHYDEELTLAGLYTDGYYMRGRTLLKEYPHRVWAVSANESNFQTDLLCDLTRASPEFMQINQVSATASTYLYSDSQHLSFGSAGNDELCTFAVASGMGAVSGPPAATFVLPECEAVTGTAEDVYTGDVYVCGYDADGLSPWNMIARLVRIPGDGSAPQVLDPDCGTDLRMPISIVMVQPAPLGDFDADHDLDLHDVGAMQGCFGQPLPCCLEDFDFDGSTGLEFADFASFADAFTGHLR